MRFIIAACLFPLTAFAGDGVLPHQGRLLGATGAAMSGTHELTFTFWSAETAGSQLGTFADTDTVQLTDGYYATDIGDAPADDAGLVPGSLFTGTAWLEMAVDGVTMAPRQRIGAVPVALSANGCAVGSSYTRPAASCVAVRDAGCASGPYWLEAGGSTFETFCDSTTDGGGWALALKTNWDAGHTYNWSSSGWTSVDLVQEGSPNPDAGTAKFDAFNRVPFTDIRVQTSAGSPDSTLVIRHASGWSSLRDMFATVNNYSYTNFTVLSGSWTGVFSACGDDASNACGINRTVTYSGNTTMVRFGNAHAQGCRGEFGFGSQYHGLLVGSDAYSNWGNPYQVCTGHSGTVADARGVIWVR